MTRAKHTYTNSPGICYCVPPPTPDRDITTPILSPPLALPSPSSHSVWGSVTGSVSVVSLPPSVDPTQRFTGLVQHGLRRLYSMAGEE